MKRKNLLHPEDVRVLLSRRFASRRGAWLCEEQSQGETVRDEFGLDLSGAQLEEGSLETPDGHKQEGRVVAETAQAAAQAGAWPLTLVLGTPTEKQVREDMAAMSQWVGAWAAWEANPANLGKGRLSWENRQWVRLGAQRLPTRLVLHDADQVARWAHQSARWRSACERRDALTARWPALAGAAMLSRHFDVLADYLSEDFERLQGLLGWLLENPSSGVYLRQLPVPGLDTKWVERRKGVVADLLRVVRGPLAAKARELEEPGPAEEAEQTENSEREDAPAQDLLDFYDLCGLRRPPGRLRMRVLCPELRRKLGGLCDIEAPVQELAAMNLSPQAVIIVENLDTGLALPDYPGTVAFMRLGHAVDQLAQLPWLGPNQEASRTGEEIQSAGAPARVIYWGDLDTHGFAILARARKIFPRLESILMDEATLMSAKHLWVQEPVQHGAEELKLLAPAELHVYLGLRAQRWGLNVRLEQERISWELALQKLAQAPQA